MWWETVIRPLWGGSQVTPLVSECPCLVGILHVDPVLSQVSELGSLDRLGVQWFMVLKVVNLYMARQELQFELTCIGNS